MIKKVGITGAGGNVGTTLVNAFYEKYELTLYDIKEIIKPKAKFIKVDFSDRKKVKGKFRGLDAIIHLAGNPRPDAPAESTIKNNFIATSFVFEEAKDAEIEKIVFASSNFYHQGAIMNILEGKRNELVTLYEAPTPRCLYADSKVFGENVGRHLSHMGIKFAALRIGWTVPQDNPSLYGGNYMRAIFCSKKDLAQAFEKALNIDRDFIAAFAVSDNDNNVFDLTQTRRILDFNPEDNSAKYF